MSSQIENCRGGASSPSTPISLTPTPSSRPTKTSAAGKRKLRSSLWNDFDKVSEQGNDIAVCHHCKSKLKGGSQNTKSLRKHLERCAKRKNVDISEEFVEVSEGEIDGEAMVRNFSFDPERCRKELASMVIVHEYPLSIVNHVGLQNFFRSLNPLFEMGSSGTIKDDVLKMYDSEKAKSFELLGQLRCRIAITANMWTCGEYKGYMAITAHFVDDAWILNNRMLRFVYVPVPHENEVLADVLMDCLLEWKIAHKVSTITVDIGSTDDGIFELLVDRLSANGSLLLNGKMLQMRCCASVLKLIVKDGLDVIGEGIENIYDSVLFWSATPQRIENFEEVARQLCIPSCNYSGLFSTTQWDSTYLMLQTALPSKDVFLRLKQSEKLYTCVPSEEEWRLAQEICDKLKEIHSVIDFCSGTTNTTANHFFPMVCEIRQRFYKWVMDPSKVISKMASDMMEKFEKYWSGCHMMVATAVVLDPRYKMKMVEYYYSLIYGQDAETEIEKVRKFCYDLLHEYEDQDRFKVQRACNSGATSPHGDSMLVGNDEPDFLLEFNLLVKLSSNNGHVKSELDCYLDEKVLPRTPGFDVLGWWKNVGIKYPILQKIARDVMAIPVSTVPSKSVFSTRGKAVSTQRSKLKPKLLEALMCSKDWLMKDMAVTCSTAEPSCASEIDADDEGFNWWE